MDLSLITTEFDGRTVLEVAGDIDLSTSPKLRARVIEIISVEHHYLVVDLTAVAFVDSTGLGVLVGAQRRMRNVGGLLILVVPPSPVRELFHVTGLDRVLTLVDCIDDATNRVDCNG